MSRAETTESRLVASWEARKAAGMNGRLHSARQEAIERFREAGLPALRSEAWKYTPIRKVLDSIPDLTVTADIEPQLDPAELDALPLADLDAFRVVLVDGRFAPALSNLEGLPAGVRVADLRSCLDDPVVAEHLDASGDAGRDTFADLSSAFVGDGVLIEVGPGAVVEKPIAIHHVATAENSSMIHPRILGVFAKGSQARVLEMCHTLGDAPVVTNSMVEFFTATHAVIDHVRVIDENDRAVHVNNLRSKQEGDSNFSTNVITVSKGVVRNQAYFLPDGEHCETHLSGFYLGQEGAHIDNHTLVDHAKPECYSNELFKGILSGKATGVFNGKVLVRMDAQKTNAYQSNKSILLDDTARMFAKPELEIYADDVKCSHGATTGELDKDALFYLRTRGIRPGQAMLMLLEAFAGDVLDRIRIDAVREHVDALIRQRLSAN